MTLLWEMVEKSEVKIIATEHCAAEPNAFRLCSWHICHISWPQSLIPSIRNPCVCNNSYARKHNICCRRRRCSCNDIKSSAKGVNRVPNAHAHETRPIRLLHIKILFLRDFLRANIYSNYECVRICITLHCRLRIAQEHTFHFRFAKIKNNVRSANSCGKLFALEIVRWSRIIERLALNKGEARTENNRARKTQSEWNDECPTCAHGMRYLHWACGVPITMTFLIYNFLVYLPGRQFQCLNFT